jgi:hypothetical protein
MLLPVQSLSNQMDPSWRLVCGTGSLSICPAPAPTLPPSCSSQSIPSHVDPRWRRCCVCGTGSLPNCPAPAPTLHPSCSSPLPVRHHRSDSQPEMERTRTFHINNFGLSALHYCAFSLGFSHLAIKRRYMLSPSPVLRIRIFPSRISDQKDSGYRIRIRIKNSSIFILDPDPHQRI